MKITSRASDYALLLLMYLATLPIDETASVKKIAVHHKLSLRFLANIANKLTIARLVVAQRGIGGGMKLARRAHEISVREVIEAVEGPIQTMFCQNTHELCSHEALCHMKNFWDEIQDDVTTRLSEKKIGDLISPPTEPVQIAV
ncbi:MAG: Rrf2 family transcriptional regulator [Deltaproteobacteria bacterium]|nr:Rrf2 family transcriptional regulator [Deltaproteobacteria bacterium]